MSPQTCSEIPVTTQSPDLKDLGAYYTPEEIVSFLVDWAVTGRRSLKVLDPACGDGRFIRGIPGATGIELDPVAAIAASARCPRGSITQADFFAWAPSATNRFDAVVGNPPFIRYQRFVGEQRKRAQEFCASHGVALSGLSSSWASFVIGAASMLRPGGRLAFVVPAEISYAVYAKPVLRFLLGAFKSVALFAPRKRLFPHLSEDCWLLRAHGFGGTATKLTLSLSEEFAGRSTVWSTEEILVSDVIREDYRLRLFLLPPKIRSLYERLKVASGIRRLGDIATVSIGYVSGANDFFHLSPSQAEKLCIPPECLQPSVRSNRDLARSAVSDSVVAEWRALDRPHLLLRLPRQGFLPPSVAKYLKSAAGIDAASSFKCRNREPWYSVPDVRTPAAFLSIMAQQQPRLVGNFANCTCTNSVHYVSFKNGGKIADLMRVWKGPLTELSCEVQGHHLGGGMLKLEPAEARAVLISLERPLTLSEAKLLREGSILLRAWRTPRGR